MPTPFNRSAYLISLGIKGKSKGQLLVAALVAALALALPQAAGAATLSATPSTLPGVFSGAAGGDTIELASGNYGTFAGGMKPGMVTLRPQAGATVTIDLDFAPAANVTVEGVTLTDAVLADSRTHDITIRNSDVPGQITLRTGELANANIVLANNVHHDYDPGGDGEGRIYLPERTSQPSGITIRDSEFYGGTSDGIQNGSNGTQILNNDFHGLEPGQGPHTDSIQLYGSQNTVIRGNYFHDLGGAPAVMAPDGAEHELIEDNVVAGDPGGYPYVISLGSDNGSTIRHNTFADGGCDYNLPCGIVSLGRSGTGTVIKDNIAGEIAIDDSDLAERSHNLLAHDNPGGASEIRGRPTYVGGAHPTSYAGYALTKGSPGRASASDGLDRGARIDVGDCQDATANVKKAKTKVRKAKRALRRASGHKQTEKAKHKLKRAKRKLRRAKRKQRTACGTSGRTLVRPGAGAPFHGSS